MNYDQVKQFKLTNDEEILCEVVEWDSQDDPKIVIRAALKIVTGENLDQGFRFFSFTPWMGFTSDPNDLHMLNAAHIIGESNPTDELMEHYIEALTKMATSEGGPRKGFHLDEFANMTEEEMADYIQSKLEEDEEESVEEISKMIH